MVLCVERSIKLVFRTPENPIFLRTYINRILYFSAFSKILGIYWRTWDNYPDRARRTTMKTMTITMTITITKMTTTTAATMILRRRKLKPSQRRGGAGRGEGTRPEGTASRRPLRPQTRAADDDDDGNDDDGLGGDNDDGPGGGDGEDDSNPDAGGGRGGGGGYHRTVLILDTHASPFLHLDRPKIRQAYRVFVVNNYNVLNLEPKSLIFLAVLKIECSTKRTKIPYLK